MEDELTGPLSLYIVIPLISIVQSSPIVSTLPRMTHNNVGLSLLVPVLGGPGPETPTSTNDMSNYIYFHCDFYFCDHLIFAFFALTKVLYAEIYVRYFLLLEIIEWKK